MRILFMGNNRLGLRVLEWLKERQTDDIVGLIVHPPEKARYRSEIVDASGLGQGDIWNADKLDEPETLECVRRCKPDVGLSILLGYVLPPRFIETLPCECINLHPSVLPYNRGVNPNIWSIVERTPAGVTLHYINEGIDTGDIISQSNVEVDPIDTGETLYAKLEEAGLDLFKRTWPEIAKGQAPRIPQADGAGTSHRFADVERIDCIDPDRKYAARDLINILRARTFPPYNGAYFLDNGEKIFMRLECLRESDMEEG